jgi:hypothetical protein
MFESSTPARRRAIIGGVIGALLAGAIVLWIAVSGDDAKPATTTPTQSSSQSSSAADGSAPIDPLNPPFQRALQTAGKFTCGAPGHWQPYLDRPLVIAVGEPPEASTCAQEVLDLPYGYCSKSACSVIPADWDIRLQPGLPPDTLLLLVAPVDSKTARLYCYRNLIADAVTQGPIGTPIEQVCPSSTGGPGNSVDLPFTPPPSNDLETFPPNQSVDLPQG